MRLLYLALAALTAIAATAPPMVTKVAWIFELRSPATPNDPAGLKCADIDKADQTAVHYWITGYFSGMNSEAGRTVGRSVKEGSVIEEVKLLCQQRPSYPVSLATQAAYDKFQADRH
jgi:hypothetical protein